MEDELAARLDEIERTQLDIQSQLRNLQHELFASHMESRRQFITMMDFLREMKEDIAKSQKAVDTPKEMMHSSESNLPIFQKGQCSHSNTRSPSVIKPQPGNIQKEFPTHQSSSLLQRHDQPSLHAQKGKRQGNFFKKPPIDPIPMTYTDLLPELIRKHLIVPIDREPRKPPRPERQSKVITCDYHLGGTGHSTEDCDALKLKVQELVQAGILKF